jgi:hypothetical protein
MSFNETSPNRSNAPRRAPDPSRRPTAAVFFGGGAVLAALLAGLMNAAMDAPAAVAAPKARPPIAWDDKRFMRVDEVRPGMRGWGLTVISGTKLDTFHVEVIAVRKNFFPQGDVILARGSGAGMELAGIVAGMSGSPVYIDGRLVGALAYGWPFMKDPIMGITPIEAMLSLSTVEDRPGEPGASGVTADPEKRRAWQSLVSTTGPAARPLVAELLGGAPAPRSADGARVVTTPLWTSGLSTRAAAELGEWLAPYGIVPLAAGAGGTAPDGEVPGPESLVPGGGVAIPFARGDIAMAAIGTVTLREGDRILAFGHPMFQRGRSRYPMATATVETVMPKVDDSFKLGSAQQLVGTIDLDLRNGIGGSIGEVPAMIPYKLTIQDDLPDAKREVNIEIMNDEPLLPVLAAVATLNAGGAAGSEAEVASLDMNYTITLADGRKIGQRHASSGVTPSLSAALALLRSLTLLTANPLERVTVKGIEASVTIRHDIEQATIEEVTVRNETIHPGDRVTVAARLEGWRGAVETLELSLAVPADVEPGDYLLRVCSAGDDRRWDQARAPGSWDPNSVDRLITLLESELPDDVMALTLVRRQPGVTAGGRDLGRLPPSVLSALAADGVSGPFALTDSRVVARATERMKQVVAGCQEVMITVTADPRGAGRPGRE